VTQLATACGLKTISYTLVMNTSRRNEVNHKAVKITFYIISLSKCLFVSWEAQWLFFSEILYRVISGRTAWLYCVP